MLQVEKQQMDSTRRRLVTDDVQEDPRPKSPHDESTGPVVIKFTNTMSQ